MFECLVPSYGTIQEVLGGVALLKEVKVIGMGCEVSQIHTKSSLSFDFSVVYRSECKTHGYCSRAMPVSLPP